MKITKILNNNAVIIKDDDQEKIAIGTGVGFNKKKNDIVNVNKIDKIFVLREHEQLQQLLLRIPEEHFTLSKEIISYAEKQLGTTLNDRILLVLTDHLSFAIEREKDGIQLKNKLLQEIKILYNQEFQIGLWAIEEIKKKFDIEMPVDEAAFIALHIHTMKMKGGDLRRTVRQTTIIRDMVETIKRFLNITINEVDLSYERLITHLRFSLTRAEHFETHSMDEEMLEMIKRKFSLSFRCAQEVARELSSSYGIDLPEEELGYITLHIERLRKF
ncbi:beta-glucoside operon transcriptional antiterminator [Evansella vedderi]|uniref:Beta-glucoside operon transcriptional antiterminator n=1 Tax=Evansella vedderi TaxID=38282 RepID=A0ABT9ZZG2_9BACI|nr:PRD domain-containing protein [Evansella vedderi]MDQ0256634.1 beta-glucoside operon transcriptional antiterminator [Evansella vedderi]